VNAYGERGLSWRRGEQRREMLLCAFVRDFFVRASDTVAPNAAGGGLFFPLIIIVLKNNNNPFQQFGQKISVNCFDIFELAGVVIYRYQLVKRTTPVVTVFSKGTYKG
jgi:hypothetical protein